MIVRLPYPPAILSPNARPHWAAKAKAVKAYRNECGFELLAQGVNHMPSVAIALTFCPPDRRRRDRDNAIHAFKTGQDAIADITGVDDSKFDVSYTPGFGEPVKGGCVVVDIRERAA